MTEPYDSERDLQAWFGLSYASWLTIPRVLMEAMPDDWQERMAVLLNEYSEAFPSQPDLQSRVQVVRGGKLIATPPWLTNYRRPDRAFIDGMRGKPSEAA